MSEALQVLLGVDAKGLSAPVVSRLKLEWANERKAWDARDLAAEEYVYWWADGVYTGLRMSRQLLHVQSKFDPRDQPEGCREVEAG